MVDRATLRPRHSRLLPSWRIMWIGMLRVLWIGPLGITLLNRVVLKVRMLLILAIHWHLVVGRLWIMSSPGSHVVEVGVFETRIVLMRFVLPLLRLEVVWVHILTVIVDFLIELWALGEEALQVEVFIPAVTH